MARTIIVALLGIGILMAMPSLLAAQGPAEEFPAAADITINGIDGGNRSGRSLASGDINNDGIPDLIIGARFAAPGGRNQAGETRVIFGPLSAGSLELSTAADITIRGIDPFDRSGFGVSSGDINDDGVTDLIIGAAFADPGLEPELRDQAGETYVIFGPLSAGTLELSTAADTTVNGIDPFDRSGIDVASGDINNDGAADLIIGGWFADPGLEPEVRDAAGETYVVFGPLSAGTLELGEPGGTVSGVVTDGTNPIAGMNVFASDFNTGDFANNATTDANGFYSITLPSGFYRVQACPECSNPPVVPANLLNEWYQESATHDGASPVEVTAANDTPNINFTLEVGGTISGFVYEVDGTTGIPNLRVHAFDFDTGAFVGGTSTLADGSYSFALLTGTYRVEACAACDGPANLVNEWYQESFRFDEATPVGVTAPNDRPDVNFTLEVGGTISGFVYEVDGTTPIPNLRVHAFDFDTGEGVGGSSTGADGSYSFPVLTGTYLVEACAECSRPTTPANLTNEWYLERPRRDDATPVSVTAPNDRPDVNFTLEAGGTISGTVTTGGAPVANLHVFAQGIDTGTHFGTNTDASGNYTLAVPSGSYRVQACAECSQPTTPANLTNEWYLESQTEQGATPVDIIAPAPRVGVDFTLEVGGTISGFVYEVDGVTGIPGVRIHAFDFETGDFVGGTRTAADGSYSAAVPSGTYQVEACPACQDEPTNLLNEWWEETLRRDEATPVEVAAPLDTPNIDFTLEVGGTISGTVYEADGITPVPNLHVAAIDFETNEWLGGPNTDANGNYTLILPSGIYKVVACADCSDNPNNLVREYWQETLQQDAAAPVSVTAPNDTPNINFTLEVGGTISGFVYEVDGTTPIPNLRVHAFDFNTGDFVGGSSTGADGSYSFALLTGTHAVEACAICGNNPANLVNEWYLESPRRDDATPVSVTAPLDTPNINFTLELGGTISGRVLLDDGITPVVDLHVFARDFNTEECCTGTNTDANGFYSITLPSGFYRVQACANCSRDRVPANLLDEFYQESATFDGAIPVEVTAPNDRPNINFTLEVGGTISGFVHEVDGTMPIPNLRVHAFDFNTGDFVGGSSTGADGSYSFPVLTGTYRVEACPACDGPTNLVNEWYLETPRHDDATLVSVTAPNDTPNINFTLEVGEVDLAAISLEKSELLTISVGQSVTMPVTLTVGSGGPLSQTDISYEILQISPAYPDLPDSDGDGVVDAVERFLFSDSADASSTPEARLFSDSCSDGVDNDGDGDVDGDDAGCRNSDSSRGTDDFELYSGSDPFDSASSPEHVFFFGTCSDGIDNDLDGFIDGAEPDNPNDSDTFGDCSVDQETVTPTSGDFLPVRSSIRREPGDQRGRTQILPDGSLESARIGEVLDVAAGTTVSVTRSARVVCNAEGTFPDFFKLSVFPSSDQVQDQNAGNDVTENTITVRCIAIAAVLEELQAFVDGNPGTLFADKLEDAVAKLQTALDELEKTPENIQAAVGNIEGAVGDLEAAVDTGLLDATVGTSLMDQLAGTARQCAVQAINEAIAAGGDPTQISQAQQLLVDGDTLRAAGAFKNAVNIYKDALVIAEGALP